MAFQKMFDAVPSTFDYFSQKPPEPPIEVAINGTDEADNVSGTPWRDVITMHGGNDTVSWSKGRDVIDGGVGELDTLSYEGMQDPLKIILRGQDFGSVSVEDAAATTAFYQE